MKLLQATNTIYPHRFVTIGSADDSVQQAGYGDLILGLSKEGTPNAFVDYAAVANGYLFIYTNGDSGYLELSGSVTSGDYLSSDNDGKGVRSIARNKWMGAVAAESGLAGDIIRVKVYPRIIKTNSPFTNGFDNGFDGGYRFSNAFSNGFA